MKKQLCLLITRSCHLKCQFCDLWRQEYSDIRDVAALIQQNLFFQTYPQIQEVHLIGGDPFEQSDLQYIVAFFKSQSLRVHVWCHGNSSEDWMASILPYVDTFYLYLPVVPSEYEFVDYQSVTGEGSFDQFHATVNFLKSEGQSIVIHTPVFLETVSVLPDVYQYVFDQKMPWLLHYIPSDFNREQKEMIRRYNRIKQVDVYPLRYRLKGQCAALPFPDYLNRFQKLRNILCEWFYGVGQKDRL